MKNVIITILAMLVLALGGYVVYDKVIDKDEKNENNVVENNTKKEDDASQNGQDQEKNQEQEKNNSYAKLYRSEDNKYVLLLAEYNHSYLNSKSQNTTARNFYLKITGAQSISYITGSYSLDGNNLSLIDSNHKFKTIYDQNLDGVLSSSAGSDSFLFNYSNNQISFGNITLYQVDDASTKLYKSDDNKYVLLLEEYNNSTDFYLTIDEIQSISYIAGSYLIDGSNLSLTAYNYNTTTQELDKVKNEFAGNTNFNLSYNSGTIKFGNITLNLVK